MEKQSNKDYQKEYQKKYREDNKEIISRKRQEMRDQHNGIVHKTERNSGVLTDKQLEYKYTCLDIIHNITPTRYNGIKLNDNGKKFVKYCLEYVEYCGKIEYLSNNLYASCEDYYFDEYAQEYISEEEGYKLRKKILKEYKVKLKELIPILKSYDTFNTY